MKPWLGALLLAGCATFESTARDDFVHQVTCPADRVTVTNEPAEAAPEDIAADPGRLAVWKADAAEKAKHRFVAQGCGEERHYVCDTASQGSSSWPECTPASTGIRRAVEQLLQGR